jgi:hypothetical protein
LLLTITTTPDQHEVLSKINFINNAIGLTDYIQFDFIRTKHILGGQVAPPHLLHQDI